ncbi:MAG: dockerin type I repeat-containing protein, partial [Clostridia bacterium]|nr:dockerin type I repeat-containing protein [Clostridia bacterium]
MKAANRILALLLSILMVLSMFSALSVSGIAEGAVPGDEAAAKLTKGDVDGDGYLTPADARLILRYSVKLEEMTDEQRDRGDMNNDGEVLANDARLALLACVLLEDADGKLYASRIKPGFSGFGNGSKKISADVQRDGDQVTVAFSASDFAGTAHGEMFIGYNA